MLTILWLLPTILWEQKKTQIKKKKRNEEKTGIKYKTWILKFDIYTNTGKKAPETGKAEWFRKETRDKRQKGIYQSYKGEFQQEKGYG